MPTTVLIAFTSCAVLAASTSGCGNTKDEEKPDRASAVDDAAVTACGSPDPVLPAWPLEVIYDLPGLGPEREGRSRGVAAVFKVGEELLLFGDNNFAKLDLDGTILQTVPYPLQPGNGLPYELHTAARGSSTFAGIVMPEARFCLLGTGGLTSVADCIDAPHPFATDTVAYQDGYLVLLGGATSSLWPVSESGTEGTTRQLGVGGVTAVGVVGTKAVLGIQTSGPSCTAQVATVSLDTEAPAIPIDLVSPECVAYGRIAIGSHSDNALMVVQNADRDESRPLECAYGAAPTSFGSFGVIVGADGAVFPPRRYGSLLLGENRVFWDSPHFLVLNNSGAQLRLYWIDTSGTIVGSAVALDLGESGNTDGSAAMAAIGPNDYLIAYGVVGPVSGTRVRRVRVTPDFP